MNPIRVKQEVSAAPQQQAVPEPEEEKHVVKTEAGVSNNVEGEIYRLLQSIPEGIDMDNVTSLTPAFTQKDRQDAINGLLANKKIAIVQGPNGSLRLKVNSSTQLSGASDEEQAIYSLIEESKTKGIWIRELRDGSGLSQLQLRKVLKSLENKKLIKAVKAVGTTKKCYMVFNLEPDTSLTGGTFYSDQQLDSELIHTLVSVCTGYIQSVRKHATDAHPDDLTMQKELSYVKTKQICDFIVEKRILNVAISQEDVERIIDVAVLDGTVERRADGKMRATSRRLYSSPLVCVPCSVCPVANDCKPGHEIAPETCQYMTDWLKSDS